ncbi:hypothetical protein [Halalkalibacter krulwichiae]|uniref:Uncharacterized protein n=1 Tax=Halalkalibacter krulwichiae TaxID=199441 RepID=A0A1X9MF30_9BACI|nr:hypothetical protein [Halalkalibacter krulwichiae]ARK29052.1 hypothetical protein BkAM31D_03860 [Halalkalibacter krulwichiae]
MEEKKKGNIPTPISIQLLFENQKLEIMKILCLLNTLSTQSNKQRKIEEILFYYSLVNYDLIKIFNISSDEKVGTIPSPNQYFRFQTRVSDILIIMSNLGFIEVKGKLSNKFDDLKVKLLQHGRDFYSENKSDYLDSLNQNYFEVLRNVAYSRENLQKIKEGHY